MSKRSYLFGLTLALLYLSAAGAQQYPILDKVADKVIQKYQTSTCEQLYQEKSQKKQPSQAEQKVIQLLHDDRRCAQHSLAKSRLRLPTKCSNAG